MNEETRWITDYSALCAAGLVLLRLLIAAQRGKSRRSRQRERRAKDHNSMGKHRVQPLNASQAVRKP